ncbi:response regulator [Luteimonas sp. 3794]|uniref:response regulator n=1 Tax=Luteimonas sp. 3794 TaxID=2817730 RepID=UPI002857E637|nr:response regulator [Luteimonas sp. 3794]MDR6990361.1 two-component system OmpR family response regulator [Luteimonas sp. 3794]
MAAQTPRIVVVDDDASIRDALSDYLSRHGFDVRAADGATALDRLLAQAPADLVVLDWMMPGEDGLSVCRRLAGSDMAVLMLSALDTPPDRVIGLEVGADDYLAKPFDPRELLARVRALLRRGHQLRQQACAPAVGYIFQGWTLRIDLRTLAAPDGSDISLTAGEFGLLAAFVERAGRVLARERLMALTHGDAAEPFDRAIDLAISRLRRKLAQAHADGRTLIQTLRGEGYRFTAHVHRL